MPVSPRSGVPEAIGGSVDYLRPYRFHGMDLSLIGNHGVGDCPFCRRDGKFSVDVNTGLGRCLVCGVGSDRGGFNALTFVRLLHEHAAARVRPKPAHANRHGSNGTGAVLGGDRALTGPAAALAGKSGSFLGDCATDRGLCSPDTPGAWGLCLCPVDNRTWILPGYGPDGRLDQVYRRTRVRDGDEWVWRMLPTPGIWPEGKVHGLHMPVGDFDPTRPRVDVMEGPWDGMAFWEVARPTDSNVVAVPGCNVWRDEWTELCRGKHVALWFDSDHPKEYVPGRASVAGYDGMRRVSRRLAGVAASVSCVRWGLAGYAPDRPSGWDVRDQLSTSPDRKSALVELRSKLQPAPAEWIVGSSSSIVGARTERSAVNTLPCFNWSTCEGAWIDAIYWRRDLGDALAVMLAVCASTPQSGNQLFLDLIGSPGSAKTTLAQGLLTSEHCIRLENVTKLLSGWKKPEDGDKDCSFLARANNKTWITCEFDVLGGSPNYHELMGKVRRIFDGETASTYGNDDKDRIYTGLRTPWIRAGTQKMMDRMADYNQSQLGDRFIRLIISDPDDGDRRRIALKALRSERLAVLDRSGTSTGSTVDSKTQLAQSLTGGYVDWLRMHAEEELARVDVPAFAEEYCVDLAELSADMRARPSEDRRKVEVNDTKELPTRLARQNIRLAMCLAVVLNKFSVDAEILRIVRKVALDTSHGYTVNMVQWLCSPNPRSEGRTYHQCGGLTEQSLTAWTGMSRDRLANYLLFLRKIGVVDMKKSPQHHDCWVLTDRVCELYTRVMR